MLDSIATFKRRTHRLLRDVKRSRRPTLQIKNGYLTRFEII
ncbi:hypothetical protein QUA82_22125 [Microcoleus sp. F8-D3]